MMPDEPLLSRPAADPRDAEIARLRSREAQLLDVNNTEVERRRRAERQRDNMRAVWEEFWAQPTREELHTRIRELLALVGQKQTEIEELTKERDSLSERARTAIQLAKGEVWYWQGDEEDHLESLTCPVIIPAEKLRALLAERSPR